MCPVFDMFTAAMFILFSLRFLNMCKPRTKFYDGPTNLDLHFMEVGYYAYQAGW